MSGASTANRANFLHSPTSDYLSFEDYKINYRHLLGQGTYGLVYEVIKRPENEKGVFSYFFPYIYDRIFVIDDEEKEPTNLCVKISKTTFRIFWETNSLRFPVKSFSQAAREERTNQVLNQYGISNIKFYKTTSLYAQFKTRVFGLTFFYYLEKFQCIDEFELRKSFCLFLQKISNPYLRFLDLHIGNIMYDEHLKHWEIIDGRVWESNEPTLEDNIKRLLGYITGYGDKTTDRILQELGQIAREAKPYTKIVDQQLLETSQKQCV